MKRARSLGGSMVLLLGLVLVLASAVTAQSLDGKWYKVNCKVTVKAVSPDTGAFVDHNFSFNYYIGFQYVSPAGAPRGSVYNYQIWCQTTSGVWEDVQAGLRGSSDVSENFFWDWWMGLSSKEGNYIETYVTPRVTVVPNSFRAGGEVYNGNDSYGRSLYGWVLMKGKLVTLLPFTPVW